ncbi:MAG: hypothetical protein CMM93_02425 [Rickettsiales bacterium]|nr:hypothetical protein [Rickettsiales bacterium]|tara:strand:+ start:265 stop:471 length:207 start_codon:yes stop_codon:yes gene_type:complete
MQYTYEDTQLPYEELQELMARRAKDAYLDTLKEQANSKEPRCWTGTGCSGSSEPFGSFALFCDSWGIN